MRRRLTLLALTWLLLVGRARAQSDFFGSSPGPLAQSHAGLEGQDKCDSCHTGGKGLSAAKCLDCHDHADQKSKIASGRGLHASSSVAGRPCWTCHLDHKGRGFDLTGWAALGGPDRFNHDLADFPLRGKHATVACNECHQRSNRQGLKLYLGESQVCGACHKADQPHRFERPALLECGRCHGEVAWKPGKKVLNFDHDDRAQAAFPVEGAHEAVACARCHPRAEFNLVRDVSECSACHESPHAGHLFSKPSCIQCHAPTHGSFAAPEFDHDKRTKFALEGKHKKEPCASCHAAGVMTPPERACESCHADESRHRRRFEAFGSPPACATCHPSNSWKPTAFDHAKKTRFALTGKHAETTCRKCHRGERPDDFERFDAAKVGCIGCHQHTKVHEGRFQDGECLTCHQMGGSLEAAEGAREMFHGEDARFPLVLGHAKVPCVKCHEGDRFTGVSLECGDTCHEDKLHKGSLGKQCSRCHTGGSFKALAFDHAKDSRYPLVGLHEKAACAACHAERKYKPTPTNCGDAACHADDDAHGRKLGMRCEKCHRESGENVFQHNKQAAFRLTGTHLDVTCKTCHSSLEFKPRPKTCFGCHPEPKVHEGRFGIGCDGCHDTVAWQRIKPIHDVGSFSLGGAHNGVDCRTCHADARPLAGTGENCASCHREDDLHAGSLGPRCGDCHGQWAFAPARFDHTTVGCDLMGQHRTLPCLDCHKAGSFGTLTTSCFGCHRDDALTRPATVNEHKTYTGCGSCHNVNTFAMPMTNAAGTESVCQ